MKSRRMMRKKGVSKGINGGGDRGVFEEDDRDTMGEVCFGVGCEIRMYE
jgi:hypothetical protein